MIRLVRTMALALSTVGSLEIGPPPAQTERGRRSLS